MTCKNCRQPIDMRNKGFGSGRQIWVHVRSGRAACATGGGSATPTGSDNRWKWY